MSALTAVLLMFSFQFMSAFILRRSARLHSGILVTQYRTSDVDENLGRYLFVRGVHTRGM